MKRINQSPGFSLRAGLVALLLAVGSGALPSLVWANAGAARFDTAFAAQSVEAVLAALGASDAQPSESLHIDAAEIAENGAEVPLAIRSELTDTDLIAVLVVNNPYKLAAVYEFPAASVPAVQTRLKLNESSEVIALARVQGRFHLARRTVRVTLGGCSIDGAAPALADPTPRPMRIRAQHRGQETEIRLLMPHPMETGLREDLSGKVLPAHYITDFQAWQGDRPVLKARFGPSVSANPYLLFSFTGAAAGEPVRAHWRDNLARERDDEALIH
ncbi:MAG: thiosulfate oxidation carrier complex protein SoxZ [Thauera sp.]|nr:thiosulfate oxidation carrier complex protein SoxZ [Thauera sp.]